MDRLDIVSIFLAVVDNGSFAGAARRLKRSPATVTRAVAGLEDRLGARLLTRTTRSLHLTDIGQHYIAGARRLIDAYQQVEAITADRSDEPSGTLRMTAPVVFGRLHVLPVVADYLQRHRAVDVDLALTDRVTNLVEEGFDLAVRIGMLPDSSLVARRIGTVRRVICASRAYLKERGRPQRPGDLAAYPAIVSSGSAAPERWSFFRNGRRRAVTVRPRLVVNGAEAAMDAAAAGLGVARVLSYQLRSRLFAGTLVSILDEWDDRVQPVHLVVPAGRFTPAKVRAFIALAAKALPPRL